MASPKYENFADCISPHPIVFIDSLVEDYQSLVNGAIPQAEVIVLDPTLDGVSQITSALVGSTDICAIHIVSHGTPGCLYLGNSKLSLDTLEYYSSQLSSWTSKSNVPLLLYGCNVALGDAGSEFLEKLHSATGAPIAASAKRIGNAQFGSTWQLEVNIGNPAAARRNQPLAFTATAQATYRGIFGITRVSVALDGTQGNNNSSNPAISDDGRFVAFQSTASNLVVNDTNDLTDIFVRDLLTSSITRVSVANDGTQGNGNSLNPAISAEGRFVAFRSTASNLVADDTNRDTDIFVRDLLLGTTTRVSLVSDRTPESNFSPKPIAISADGQFVAFESGANNLVAGDTNNSSDIFVRDLQTGTTTRVSVANDGTQGNGNFIFPAISADGRFVAFDSSARNLVALDTNNSSDIFVRDLQTGTTTRVSIASDGTQGNERSFLSSISGDGRFVVFESRANNLVRSDTNNSDDIFVRDLLTGTTTRVSVANDGTEGNNDSDSFSDISTSGQFVTFYSLASNLVAGDTNDSYDIFVRDLLTGTTTRVSVANDGTEGNSNSSNPAISGDGRFVAFQSTANNLVESDTNNSSDIFVRETNNLSNSKSDDESVEYTATRVSVANDGTQGNNGSFSAAISGDGRFVTFASIANNLVAGDTNNLSDIFVRDLLTGTTTLISVANDGTPANRNPVGATWGSFNPAISGNGRFVAFNSDVSSLVALDTNFSNDILVRDLQTGTTTLVSVASDGTQGDDDSLNPTISPDGRFVAFESTARLTAEDTNFTNDIFVRDLQTGTTTRIPITNDNTQRNDERLNPAISGDGRFVAFNSRANNLVAGDTNNSSDIFVRDLQTGTITRVSLAQDGSEGDGPFDDDDVNNPLFAKPAISASGRFVAFESRAFNLVAEDTNNSSDIFVRDLQTGTITRVSVALDGTEGNNNSSSPTISADGRFVAFNSDASNLVVDDTNNRGDVFVRDLLTGIVTRIAVNDFDLGSTYSSPPAISDNGRVVAFQSDANNLVARDTNNSRDIFVREINNDKNSFNGASEYIITDGIGTSGGDLIPSLMGDYTLTTMTGVDPTTLDQGNFTTI